MLAQPRPAVRRIPATRATQAIGGSSALAAKDSPTARVLVVDDEWLLRWSVSEVLVGRGFEVREAMDASSALQALSGKPSLVDIVLLDLRLPDSDGFRLLAAIRGLSPLTPVILMTAFHSPEIVEEARQLGAVSVIDKPFDVHALPSLLGQTLLAAAG